MKNQATNPFFAVKGRKPCGLGWTSERTEGRGNVKCGCGAHVEKRQKSGMAEQRNIGVEPRGKSEKLLGIWIKGPKYIGGVGHDDLTQVCVGADGEMLIVEKAAWNREYNHG